MSIKNFSVNNNAGLAASSGNPLSLTFTVNYSGDDTRNTLKVTYTIDGQPGGVTFCGLSANQTLDTPTQYNASVPGGVCLQGGSSGNVGVKVTTATGEEDHMVISYKGTALTVKPAFGKKTPVLLGIQRMEAGEGAPKKAAPKKAAPKKASPKKATPKKATPKKAAPKKASPKKAAPKKATPKKSSRKKPGR